MHIHEMPSVQPGQEAEDDNLFEEALRETRPPPDQEGARREDGECSGSGSGSSTSKDSSESEDGSDEVHLCLYFSPTPSLPLPLPSSSLAYFFVRVRTIEKLFALHFSFFARLF